MKAIFGFAHRHRRFILCLAVAALLALAIGGRALYLNNDTSRADAGDDVVKLADYAPTDRTAITRGQYVAASSDCAACHTPFAHGGVAFAGGHQLRTPFGTIVATNITPDRKAGIDVIPIITALGNQAQQTIFC